MKSDLKFEEFYFEGYYKGIADFTKKRDRELANWFKGMFSFKNFALSSVDPLFTTRTSLFE